MLVLLVVVIVSAITAAIIVGLAVGMARPSLPPDFTPHLRPMPPPHAPQPFMPDNGFEPQWLDVEMEYSPTHGPAPLTVTFRATVIAGSPDEWQWTITRADGFGVEIFGQEATYMFREPGEYQVSLMASDAASATVVLGMTPIVVTSPDSDE